MKHNIITWSILFSVLAFAGCSSSSPFDSFDDKDLAQRVRSVVADNSTPTDYEPYPRRDIEAPPDGLEGYVAWAMKHNPQIQAAAQKVERLRARIDQATSLDDPMVTYASGEMAETAAGQVGFVAGVSQRLPYPGKLGARGKIATRQVAEAAAGLERVKLRVAGDVRRAYWRYYYAARGIEIATQSEQLVTSFKETAESMLRAGRAEQEDVLRASVELTDLESRIVVLKQQQQTAVAMLNSLLDLPAGTPLPPPPAIEFTDRSLELDVLLRQAQASSPQITAARARVAGFRERWELAKLDSRPDFQVGFSYGAVDSSGLAAGANGDDQWWATLGMTLPIWADKQDAARSEALHGIGETLNELRAAQNRVAFNVQDSLARVESQRQLIALFEERMLPEAKQAVDVSIRAYRAGRVEFLTLIDNWKQLLRFELMQHQNLARMEQALADLREAVGGELSVAGSSLEPRGAQGSVDR